MTTDRSRHKRLQRELERSERRADELAAAYADLRRDYNKALRYVDLLRNDINAVFGSLTWRIGHTTTTIARRLLGRGNDPQAADHIRTVLKAFDEWQQPRLDAPVGRTRAALTISARRPCFAREAPTTPPPRVGLLVARREDGEPTGSAWIRLLEPLGQAAERGHLHTETIAAPAEVDDALDAVIVQRAVLQAPDVAERLVYRARQYGVALLVDLDDDLFSVDRRKAAFSSSALAALKQVLAAADHVVVSTTELANRIGALNDRISVIENGIDVTRWTINDNAPGEAFRALYMGTRTHSEDLALIRPAVHKLKQSHPAFDVDIIGGFATSDRPFGNVIDVPDGDDLYPAFVPWLIERNEASIGLAPLADTPFNRAKSGLKFLQYTAMGLATVASRTAYEDIIDDGRTGLLVADDPDAWVAAISSLEDPERRAELVANARTAIGLDHDLSLRTAQWQRTLGAVLRRHHARTHDDALPFDPATYLFQNPDVVRGQPEDVAKAAARHFQTLGRSEILDGLRRYYPALGPPDCGRLDLTDTDREELARQLDAGPTGPVFSILMPVYKVDPRWLEAAIDSVLAQVYPDWQLCIVDDGSGMAELDAVLDRHADDARIRIQRKTSNDGIAQTSNDCLSLATGEFIALLDHDDVLTPDALAEMALAIREHDPDVLYSDEAKLDGDCRIVEPHYKPEFSQDQILAQNYISHLGVYRAELVHEVGGFRTGFEGSQDHDLLLRVLKIANRVIHLPRILYLWRQVAGSTASVYEEKDYAWEAGRRAVADLAAEIAPGSKVTKGEHPGTYRVQYPIAGDPLVSIIVPFRDHADLLDQALTSIVEHTTHRHFEFIGVDNGSVEAQTRDVMARWERADERIRFVAYDRPFNYAAINNHAARFARGQHLLLLNNDITIDHAGWLEALLEYSQRPDVGAVGGLLLYPDRQIQHAGVILGLGGVAGHSHKHLASDHHGYFARPHVVQSISAVTGACLMIKTELWSRLGGLDAENLAVAFNDIDLCLRARELGYDNIYTPHCRLIHHESKSRGYEDTPEKMARFSGEAAYMRQRHALALALGDPCYNPNLTLHAQDFSTRTRTWTPL